MIIHVICVILKDFTFSITILYVLPPLLIFLHILDNNNVFFVLQSIRVSSNSHHIFPQYCYNFEDTSWVMITELFLILFDLLYSIKRITTNAAQTDSTTRSRSKGLWWPTTLSGSWQHIRCGQYFKTVRRRCALQLDKREYRYCV